MSDAKDYRQFAEQCLKLTDDPEMRGPCRKALLEVAMIWVKLADDAGFLPRAEKASEGEVQAPIARTKKEPPKGAERF